MIKAKTNENIESPAFYGIRPEEVVQEGKEGITFPDGSFVRKGTIKATFDNVDYLNEIIADDLCEQKTDKIDKILNIISELSEGYYAIKLFKVFTLKEWLADNSNSGRILVALTYLEIHYANHTFKELKNALMRLKEIRDIISYPEINQRTVKIINIIENYLQP